MRLVYLAALCLAAPVGAAELKIDLGHGVQSYDTASLLKRGDVHEIRIPDDVAYHGERHYRALPLRTLLPGVMRGDHLQFVAIDGFSAEIDAEALLGGSAATPWLAIEDPARPWPPLAGGKSAGPFYVVWTDPAAGGIGSEQWPYQVAMIRKLAAVAERFPATAPDPALPANNPIRHGYAVFQRTCFACHTLNGQGDAKLGPDLNVPHSPTEYLREDLLRAYIRDPQSLRRWPEAKMHGVDAATLPDADLDDLLKYLRHMVMRKSTPAH